MDIKNDVVGICNESIKFLFGKEIRIIPKNLKGGGGEVVACIGVRASLFNLIISDSFVQNGVGNYQKITLIF